VRPDFFGRKRNPLENARRCQDTFTPDVISPAGPKRQREEKEESRPTKYNSREKPAGTYC